MGFLPLQPQAQRVIHHDGKQHQQHILRFAPSIEKEAAEKQNKIFPEIQSPGDDIVQPQRDRQKIKQKKRRAENHIVTPGLMMETGI